MKSFPAFDGLLYALWLVLVLAAAAPTAVTSSLLDTLATGLFWGVVYGLGLCYAHNRHTSHRQTPPPKQLIDTIAAIGLLVFTFGLLAGHLVHALMSLLLWLQAARNFALAARRDVHFALTISLTLIIFAASEAKSNWFLLLLLVYGLAILTVLIYCHQHRGQASEENVVNEPAGLAKPTLVHQGNRLPLTNLILLVSFVFVFALGWYLLVPRPHPTHFGVVPVHGGSRYSRTDWENEARQAQHPKSAQNKQTSRLDEQGDEAAAASEGQAEPDADLDITRSQQSGGGPNGMIMYVDANRTLYLRRRTFEYFANNRWYAKKVANFSQTRKLLPSELTGKFEIAAPSDPILVDYYDEGIHVDYSVHVVSMPGLGLPLSAQAISVDLPAEVIAQASDGTVFLPSAIEPGFRYNATSVLPLRKQARPIAYDDLDDAALYLQLPAPDSKAAVTPRIVELAKTVTASASTPLEQALALEAHLRSSYTYSFATVFTSQNLTPLDDFLFVSKRGHCEFFASAMAIMLREIGIPSRVVHGYLAHNYNPITGLYEVRSLDGHAWVEAHIKDRGWVTFEPTGAYPIPQAGKRKNESTLQQLKDYTEKLEQQDVAQGQVSPLATLAALLRALNDGWHALVFQVQLLVDQLRAWLSQHAGLLAITLSAVAVLAVLAYRQRAALRWAWAKMLLRHTPPVRIPVRAVKLLEGVADCKHKSLGKQAGETVDEYLTRLELTCPYCCEELRLLVRLFNAARYDNRCVDQSEVRATQQAFYAVGNALVGLPVNPGHLTISKC